jgi:thiamine-phosphate pyrophosphorylase
MQLPVSLGYKAAMTAEIYLIAPADAAAAPLPAGLEAALTAPGVAALLLPRGNRAENAYKDFVKAIAPHAQAAGVAVLIEGEPGLVRMLGADGLHVTGGAAAVREAVDRLKPDLIVGVGGVRSRDDAMQQAELGVDYILFGPLSGPIPQPQRELARWWAETMEIPSVLSDPEATPQDFAAEGCEFIGLGTAAWEAVA